MSWDGGSTGSSPFLHQTCLQALALAEGTGGAQTRSLPFSQHQLLKKRLQPPLGCVEAAEAPWLCLDFSVGPAVPHPPRFAVPSPGGLDGAGSPGKRRWQTEGWRREGAKKKCAGEMNQLLRASLPELIPILLFPRRKAFGREKWEEGFPSTPSRNHPPLGTVLLRYVSSPSPRT